MRYLGIDTSSCATSAAVYDSTSGSVLGSVKINLQIKDGDLGMQQNDAIFLHTQNVSELMEQLTFQTDISQFDAVGVSVRSSDENDSYMPAFLAGQAIASAIAAVMKVPVYEFSHQAGHIMSSLFGTNFYQEIQKDFLAFHVSSGTTDALLCSLNAGSLTITELGTSLDIHAGQVIDRVGRMIGLRFPSGEQMDELAEKSNTYDLANPVLKGCNCCLAGLENQCKTIYRRTHDREYIARYCLNSIAAVILSMSRILKVKYLDLSDIVYAGGVMSSTVIRKFIMGSVNNARFTKPAWLSGDNAVGVSILAARSHEMGQYNAQEEVSVLKAAN